MPNKPDFIIVGAQKAATSSLYYTLTQHPDIDGPSQKELHFFGTRSVKENGVKWYYDQFPDRSTDKMILGEGTPNYAYNKGALDEIHNILGKDIKIVLCLRNPVDRLLSSYTHFRAVGKIHCKESTCDEKTLEHLQSHFMRGWKGEHRSLEEITSAQGKWGSEYFRGGRYATQLDKLWELFGRKNVKVILFEQLITDTDRIIKDLHSFLGVTEMDSDLKRSNTSDKWLGIYDSSSEVTPEIRERLVNYYKPWNAVLGQMLNRKLNWNK